MSRGVYRVLGLLEATDPCEKTVAAARERNIFRAYFQKANRERRMNVKEALEGGEKPEDIIGRRCKALDESGYIYEICVTGHGHFVGVRHEYGRDPLFQSYPPEDVFLGHTGSG